MSGTSVVVVGSGSMARGHIQTMLQPRCGTVITGFIEPDAASRTATRALFEARGLDCPPFHDSLRQFLDAQMSADAALICTPHKYHLENTLDCLRAGMDVCLEKPMVMNVAEAQALIRCRDETTRLVMVAFPGSLSPAIREAKRLISEGVIGRVTAISAFAHQGWRQGTTGTWRQIPEVSGGGFLFDTGSHMVNTVVDLLGDDVAKVSALLDDRGAPVEIVSSVSGISRGGVMFSLTGAGDSLEGGSEITVFGDEGLLKTGIWGESLRLKTRGQRRFASVRHPRSKGPWAQFLNVRAGNLENPCPPEIGLRFARLMDMIRESASSGRTIAAIPDSNRSG
jgi:predicted dehydrogenase